MDNNSYYEYSSAACKLLQFGNCFKNNVIHNMVRAIGGLWYQCKLLINKSPKSRQNGLLVSKVLQRQQHRVRYSDSVEIGSVIFSLSGVAFLLSDTQELLMAGEEQYSKRIQNFINIHRNSFLVLSAALHGPEEWNVMFRVQRRFLGTNLRIIPVHNTAETVKLMLTIAKTTSKPKADDICYKMEMTKAQIIENSPVWKMLQEYQLQCN